MLDLPTIALGDLVKTMKLRESGWELVPFWVIIVSNPGEQVTCMMIWRCTQLFGDLYVRWDLNLRSTRLKLRNSMGN